MKLSFILPYYRRAAEWFRAYAHNKEIFDQDETEVVLCIDDPTDKLEVVDALEHWNPKTRFRVMSYSFSHPWRGPARALNVGLANARGEFVCVLSPETHIDLPYPSFLMEWTVWGKLYGHGLYHHWLAGLMHYGRLREEPWRANWPEGFGMLMTSRERLEKIGGWDENWNGAGEDDDIRNRLGRCGITRLLSSQIRLTHYASNDSLEQGGTVPRTRDHYRGGDNEPIVKNDGNWGQEKGWTKIWDWNESC